MSNFKRKVNIVESTTPPSNIYDWWYDLNNEVLKRHHGGSWEIIGGYDTPQDPNPEPGGSSHLNAPNGEIWVYFQVASGSDGSVSFSELERSEDYDTSTGRNVFKVSSDYSAFTVSDVLSDDELHDLGTDDVSMSIIIVLPPSVTTFKTNWGNTFAGAYDDVYSCYVVIVGSPTLRTIEDQMYDSATNPELEILHLYLPGLQLVELVGSFNSQTDVSVYVPEEKLVDQYENADNWSALDSKKFRVDSYKSELTLDDILYTHLDEVED